MKIAIVTENTLNNYFLGINVNQQVPVGLVVPLTTNPRRVTHWASLLKKTTDNLPQDDEIWSGVFIQQVKLEKVSRFGGSTIKAKKETLTSKRISLSDERLAKKLGHKANASISVLKSEIALLENELEILNSSDLFVDQLDFEEDSTVGFDKIHKWFMVKRYSVADSKLATYHRKYLTMCSNGRGLELTNCSIKNIDNIIGWLTSSKDLKRKIKKTKCIDIV